MSKVSDLSSNNASNASRQLSGADLSTSPNAAKTDPAESQGNPQSAQLHGSNSKPNDLMAASSLINSTIQLRSDLARKLDDNNQANKTNDQSDDEKLGRRNNSHGKKISSKLSESTTALQATKQGLRKHAAEAGLSSQAQDDFVEEQAQKFTAQPENEGLKDNSGVCPADTALASFQPEENSSQATNLDLLTFPNQTSNLGQAANPKQAADLPQAANLNKTGLTSDDYSAALGFTNSASQRTAIERRFPAPVQEPREFETLSSAIQRKIEDVLQKLGLGSGETNISGAAKSAKELHLVSEFLDAQKPHEAKDKALFATAFGVATEASSKSRARHGDGVLQEFANYGDKALTASKEVNQAALVKLLQHGTQAGYPALLKSVDSDFSQTELKSVEQIKQKLGAEKTSNLVVGVVTMSVMTREVVEQLNQVAVNSSLGLSDNALAALQKAHNSLRDHLTPTDVIGAVGNLKNTQIEIEGARYNFLPEVNEALNSLREARSRILSETMYLKSDASGTDAQQRFVREAETLFGITERIESILGV